APLMLNLRSVRLRRREGVSLQLFRNPKLLTPDHFRHRGVEDEYDGRAAHSELPWAITEYITEPRFMRELTEQLRQPSGQIPEAFQFVLRVTEQTQVPVRV